MTQTNRLTTQDLADIRTRADKATEGEWSYVPIVDMPEFFVSGENGNEAVAENVFTDNDATFIAHSRQDIPRLLSEVETLIAEKAKAKRKLDATTGILLEYQRTGVTEMSVEIAMELLGHIREELHDHGE